ncbi:sucrase ferredoxin [Nocardioides sp. 616]|uniref:sucrase ferredoxin n=1 Tax=Nocardioides sp. 616 TaxID=2268090 RepID=UPI000CE2CD0A|nr:sucrase ferredoxin [Nocardioides sp. 616]
MFRCSVASRIRDDDLAGTASTVRSFLLLQHPGPWGVDALRDARLPDGLGERLRAEAHRARTRVLLIRRTGRSNDRAVRVFAARVAGPDSWLGTATLDGIAEVADLDLVALARGEHAGLETHEEPVLAVCTHGRHDVCCAERGRPVARALSADPALADQVWECSHIGGDRFAGNVLVLPRGLYYGGLDPDTALEVGRAHGRGRLVLENLRGRSDLPMVVQSAEIALRHHLGLTGLDDVVPLARTTQGALTTARFAVTAVGHHRTEEAEVVLRRSFSGEPHRLTCAAVRPDPVPQHDVVSISLD